MIKNNQESQLGMMNQGKLKNKPEAAGKRHKKQVEEDKENSRQREREPQQKNQQLFFESIPLQKKKNKNSKSIEIIFATTFVQVEILSDRQGRPIVSDQNFLQFLTHVFNLSKLLEENNCSNKLADFSLKENLWIQKISWLSCIKNSLIGREGSQQHDSLGGDTHHDQLDIGRKQLFKSMLNGTQTHQILSTDEFIENVGQLEDGQLYRLWINFPNKQKRFSLNENKTQICITQQSSQTLGDESAFAIGNLDITKSGKCGEVHLHSSVLIDPEQRRGAISNHQDQIMLSDQKSQIIDSRILEADSQSYQAQTDQRIVNVTQQQQKLAAEAKTDKQLEERKHSKSEQPNVQFDLNQSSLSNIDERVDLNLSKFRYFKAPLSVVINSRIRQEIGFEKCVSDISSVELSLPEILTYCPFIQCRKEFKHSGNLKTHLRSHTNSRPYHCPQSGCKMSFITKGHLNTHLLNHRIVKPFRCALCPAQYSQKLRLQIHIWKHQGIKPFECKICGKNFTEKGNLNVHLKIHENFTEDTTDRPDDRPAAKQSQEIKHSKKINNKMFSNQLNITAANKAASLKAKKLADKLKAKKAKKFEQKMQKLKYLYQERRQGERIVGNKRLTGERSIKNVVQDFDDDQEMKDDQTQWDDQIKSEVKDQEEAFEKPKIQSQSLLDGLRSPKNQTQVAQNDTSEIKQDSSNISSHSDASHDIHDHLFQIVSSKKPTFELSSKINNKFPAHICQQNQSSEFVQFDKKIASIDPLNSIQSEKNDQIQAASILRQENINENQHQFQPIVNRQKVAVPPVTLARGAVEKEESKFLFNKNESEHIDSQANRNILNKELPVGSFKNEQKSQGFKLSSHSYKGIQNGRKLEANRSHESVISKQNGDSQISLPNSEAQNKRQKIHSSESGVSSPEFQLPKIPSSIIVQSKLINDVMKKRDVKTLQKESTKNTHIYSASQLETNQNLPISEQDEKYHILIDPILYLDFLEQQACKDSQKNNAQCQMTAGASSNGSHEIARSLSTAVKTDREDKGGINKQQEDSKMLSFTKPPDSSISEVNNEILNLRNPQIHQRNNFNEQQQYLPPQQLVFEPNVKNNISGDVGIIKQAYSSSSGEEIPQSYGAYNQLSKLNKDQRQNESSNGEISSFENQVETMKNILKLMNKLTSDPQLSIAALTAYLKEQEADMAKNQEKQKPDSNEKKSPSSTTSSQSSKPSSEKQLICSKEGGFKPFVAVVRPQPQFAGSQQKSVLPLQNNSPKTQPQQIGAQHIITQELKSSEILKPVEQKLTQGRVNLNLPLPQTIKHDQPLFQSKDPVIQNAGSQLGFVNSHSHQNLNPRQTPDLFQQQVSTTTQSLAENTSLQGNIQINHINPSLSQLQTLIKEHFSAEQQALIMNAILNSNRFGAMQNGLENVNQMSANNKLIEQIDATLKQALQVNSSLTQQTVQPVKIDSAAQQQSQVTLMPPASASTSTSSQLNILPTPVPYQQRQTMQHNLKVTAVAVVDKKKRILPAPMPNK